MSQPSIFTQIINGDIHCHKVYEDAETFAFLDIHPIQPGQVLVVPKKEVDAAWDLDDQTYAALMRTAKQVALRLRQVFPDKDRVGMQVEGLDVAHAHLKIFPFSTHDEFFTAPDMQAEPDHQALAELAARLAF